MKGEELTRIVILRDSHMTDEEREDLLDILSVNGLHDDLSVEGRLIRNEDDVTTLTEAESLVASRLIWLRRLKEQ